MGKKGKLRTTNTISHAQISKWFAMATESMQIKDWNGVIEICKRILLHSPKKSTDRADALSYLGNAYAMKQEFGAAFQALSEALTMTPADAFLWFNRGLTDRYLSLTGQSVRDLEKAVSLLQDTTMLRKFKDELKFSENIVRTELSTRNKGFTLEQLIKQQEYFYQGNSLMLERKWAEAEHAFKNAIIMSDCLPNPQGNLGICLMMQRRFDEAEAALRRALEIDKKYALAKQNLKVLDDVRSGGPLPDFTITEPFKGKTSVSMTVYKK
jgi:tetratricopeptide (TPR) repeat protein